MRNHFILLACLPGLVASAQTTPVIEWQKSLGSTANDIVNSIVQTIDGGYIMAAYTGGNSGDVSGFHGGFSDAWIVKLDAQGNIQWQRALGGSGGEGVGAVLQANDGGYIMAGSTASNDGDVTENHGGVDVWVVKLDADGNMEWARAFGGTLDDDAHAIEQTNDGGYIIAAESRSSDGDVTGNHGGPDSWILKLDGGGNLQWQTCMGGTGYDAAYSIRQTSDGGYVFAGETGSNDGDVTGNHGGDGIDWWVVKLDDDGIIEWQKTLGGTGNDVAHSVQQTGDGGYIVAGEVDSGDGDVTGYYGFGDFWLVKLDLNGGIQWQQCYGGSSLETAQDVVQLSDDGYIITGSTRSEDGQVTGYQGGQMGDVWVVRTDVSGQLLWQKTLGGSESDGALAIQKSSDGGYIIAGFSDSNDGDVTGNHGGRDCWVVKLGPDNVGIAELQNPVAFSLFPNPSTDAVNIQLNSAASNMARLQLYSAAGQLVETPVDEWIPAGKHTIHYSTEGLPTGVYELILTTGGRTFTRNLVKL